MTHLPLLTPLFHTNIACYSTSRKRARSQQPDHSPARSGYFHPPARTPGIHPGWPSGKAELPRQIFPDFPHTHGPEAPPQMEQNPSTSSGKRACFKSRRHTMRHSWGRGPAAGGPDPGLGRPTREREGGRDGDGGGLAVDLAVGQRLLPICWFSLAPPTLPHNYAFRQCTL